MQICLIKCNFKPCLVSHDRFFHPFFIWLSTESLHIPHQDSSTPQSSPRRPRSPATEPSTVEMTKWPPSDALLCLQSRTRVIITLVVQPRENNSWMSSSQNELRVLPPRHTSINGLRKNCHGRPNANKCTLSVSLGWQHCTLQLLLLSGPVLVDEVDVSTTPEVVTQLPGLVLVLLVSWLWKKEEG